MQSLDIRMDFFGFFMFLGVMQGFFLTFFFFRKNTFGYSSNYFLGLSLLTISLLILEVFLCYTNYMFRLLYWVDFSEPLNLALPPLVYLYVRSKLGLKKQKYHYLHFLPFVIWSLYSVVWQFQHIEFKYNAYLGAYHPEMPRVATQEIIPYYFLRARWLINHLLFYSLLMYSSLSWYELNRVARESSQSLWVQATQEMAWLRDGVLILFSVTLVFITTKLAFEHDLGDHLIVTWVTILIYAINYRVMVSGHFFKQSDSLFPKPKYEKSSLSDNQEKAILEKLQNYLNTHKPYLDNTLSLPKLAKQLQISTHHLSQIINNQLNQSFFELIAFYRVREAQGILAEPKNHHLKIEEIAERVGYNSKSAFNTAFKKYTQMTPSAYRKQFN